MKQTYLNKLEYNKILEILETYCNTYISKDLAKKLMPSNDKNEVQDMLLETSQCLSLLYQNGVPPISEIDDITVYLKILESSGTLSITALLSLNKILKISQELKDYFFVDHIDLSNYNMLQPLFDVLYSNTGIIKTIKKSIVDENTLADNASDNLNRIRKSKRKLEQEIKNKLNSTIHSSSYSKYMQENIVTIKNDRFVIPIKSEYRSVVKGFIHDISSTGSTVFIEPIAVFDLNNEINNLQIEENIEIEKILQTLTSLFSPYTEELKLDLETIGKLDFIFAKAKYSKAIYGITPSINTDKKFSLINAKHPLINEASVVPITIELGNNYSSLIITGPNAGGKTVTLKTVGLLMCMACSGLNIPASESSSIYVFDEIFADIGDDQSIAESLSTFSAHMTNIIEVTKTATKNSLVLLDELCSGTDPVEGAALAVSILDYLSSIGSMVISTTHYQELKQYALVTKNFENASVEFDVENLRPTYKLLVGVPGKSNAFAISNKLGLDESIINSASAKLTSTDISIEEVLKNIYDNKIKIEQDKNQIEHQLLEIKNLRQSLEQDNSDLIEKAKNIINDAKTEARNILLDAKDEASEIIKKMNDKNQDISSLNNLRNSLNDSIKSINTYNDISNVDTTNSLEKEKILPNTPVFITTLNQEGIVLSHINKNNEVQVQIGSLKTNINIKHLQESKKENVKTSSSVSYKANNNSKSKSATTEINVIGLNVEEANFVIDKFLDDCVLAKLSTCRIVHGKGTGALRNGIHAFLKKHPHVKSFRMGTFGEGEMGVTVVELK